MEPHRDEDQLAKDLRALKPTPRPQFAAKLDERAAAGFPRRSQEHGAAATGSQLAPIFDWLRSLLSPRRALIPAGGLAMVAIAVTTAVVAVNDSGESVVNRSSKPADTASSINLFSQPRTSELHPVPQAETARAGSAAAGSEPEALSGEIVTEEESSAARATRSTSARPRAVERSAQIVLAAEPGDVAEDAAKVFETVRAHNGIVMSSSTSQGAPGDAGARFELLIPSAKLGDALADLSAIDEVRSRREATADITAPTVNVGELLQDSKARMDSLLGQLEGSETESEREAVEAELRQERRHRARLRGQLQQLQKRADLSRVSLRIETGAEDDSSGGGGAWGVDDAIRDAAKILSVAAAVTLVVLAVLAPIALIALLAWLAHRAWVRRERRRVLS